MNKLENGQRAEANHSEDVSPEDNNDENDPSMEKDEFLGVSGNTSTETNGNWRVSGDTSKETSGTRYVFGIHGSYCYGNLGVIPTECFGNLQLSLSEENFKVRVGNPEDRYKSYDFIGGPTEDAHAVVPLIMHHFSAIMDKWRHDNSLYIDVTIAKDATGKWNASVVGAAK